MGPAFPKWVLLHLLRSSKPRSLLLFCVTFEVDDSDFFWKAASALPFLKVCTASRVTGYVDQRAGML